MGCANSGGAVQGIAPDGKKIEGVTVPPAYKAKLNIKPFSQVLLVSPTKAISEKHKAQMSSCTV
jgi:hypothetical protein